MSVAVAARRIGAAIARYGRAREIKVVEKRIVETLGRPVEQVLKIAGLSERGASDE